ncbi:MAG: hypothetical protein RIM99_10080 [Cyclobacteriaceae bacterium]
MEIINAKDTHEVIGCSKETETKGWFAWNNLMPPGPPSFYVKGLVQVSNPGVFAQLVYKVPQGINPDILLLDLVLIQRPGIWPRPLTWVEARYHSTGVDLKYTDVNIFCGDQLIAEIPVQDIH